MMPAAPPDLAALLHRLADCPADFLLPPKRGSSGIIHVAAVVNDVLAHMGGERLSAIAARSFSDPPRQSPDGWLNTVLVACWLLGDPWFAGQGDLAGKATILLSSDLQPLARLVTPDQLVADPDRREELVRICLARLDLRPQGESDAAARDRLSAISSVERERVAREAAAAERRAREVRQAMAAKRAREAAAVYNRE